MKPQSSDDHQSSRRAFLNKLAIGTVSGLVAGSSACSADGGKETKEEAEQAIILQDPNVCRGLNTCKGKGSGEHECAGQGSCATAEAHSCKGDNACKGQGGCGATGGQNACKSQGECAVPLSEKAWTKARSAFEIAAKDAGIKVGPAPAKS
jgi:hypothetical protein